MDVARWSDRHATMIWGAAALAGPTLAGVLSLARPAMHDNHATLLLVLMVTLVSASGLRAAGIAAAVTSGLAYDYYWTEPYGSLVITDPGDIVTVLLLVVVAAASGQLSWRAAQQRAAATRQRNYLNAVKLAAGATSGDSSGDDAPAGSVEAVCQAVTTVLEADWCRVVPGAVSGRVRLHTDGSVTYGDRLVDVDRSGLPTNDVIAVAVGEAGSTASHFEVSAGSRYARPSLEQRQVAALLARLAGAGLSNPH